VLNDFRKLVFGLAGIVLLASGCQSASATKTVGLDNPGFMTLWDTYSHCRVSSDLSLVGNDLKMLTDASQVRNGNDGFVLPLPGKLQRLVTDPTSRFAVDVRAMASACSLHAGQLALESGRRDVARELFETVFTLYPHEESSYYRIQAKALLAELDRGIDVSLKTP